MACPKIKHRKCLIFYHRYGRVPKRWGVKKDREVFFQHPAKGWFDAEYYAQQHVLMVVQRVGRSAGFLGVTLEVGAGGESPDDPAPEAAICRFHFESRAAFEAAFAPHWPEIEADVPRYTDLVPVLGFYTPVVLPAGSRTSKS